MLTFCAKVQPCASVTVHVQVPAVKLFAVAVDCAGLVFQLYVYGPEPPVAVTVADPLLSPKQPTWFCALMLVLSAPVGCVMVTLRVNEHPFASVIVHVHVPAERLLAEALFCAGVVFQLYE